jgi:hypothetical protein
MKFLSLLSFLFPKQKKQRPKTGPKPDSLKTRCLRHLIAHNHIDAWSIQKMGSTDARKMISDLRKDGYLHPFGHAKAFIEVRNAKDNANHRRHFWSGKVPAKWVRADGYTGHERLATVRAR